MTPVVTPSDLSDGELILAAQGFWAVSEGFAIQSARQYALALEVLGVAKLAWKVLEERRVTITGPLNHALAIYKDCEAILEKKMVAYCREAASRDNESLTCASIRPPTEEYYDWLERLRSYDDIF